MTGNKFALTKIFRGVGSEIRLRHQKNTRRLVSLEPYFSPKERASNSRIAQAPQRKSPTKTKLCHRPLCRTSTHSPTTSNTFHPKTQTKTRRKPPRNPSHPSKKTTNSKTSPSKVALPTPRGRYVFGWR